MKKLIMSLVVLLLLTACDNDGAGGNGVVNEAGDENASIKLSKIAAGTYHTVAL